MRSKIYLGLVHAPVYNRNGEVVATSVTNFDIHDISRTSKTYDIKNYYIITPVDAQIELTKRIIGYWQDGSGKEYNENRGEAFERTLLAYTIEDAVKEIEKKEGKKPKIVTTSAKNYPNSISYQNMSEKIFEDDEVYFLLFGTGWGLIEEVMNSSDYVLDPIRAKAAYNHLSVRAAVAIILDRLLGEK
jgi:hypothetical protein